MIATDVGRKGIIKRAREVNDAAAVRYSDARKAIRAALADSVSDKKIVNAARESFEQKTADASLTSWVRDDAAKSIDVMDSFLLMRNQLIGFNFTAPPNQQSILQIAGVAVSVNCDVLIHGDIKNVPSRGAALFRLTKPDEEETSAAKSKRHEMGANAATLVLMYLQSSSQSDAPISNELCWSLDIQAGDIIRAPKNYTNRKANMETACEFIAAMWDKV